MKKFFGEMTREEFFDALKVIFSEEKEKKSFSQNIKEIKDDIIKILLCIKNIVTLKFLKEPLTKEVFIKRGKIAKEIIDTVVFVLVALIIIRFFMFEIRWIPSASMNPTLIEGDRVLVERYSRFNSSPQRGDIMVFYPPQTQLKNDAISLFKRLTGLFCKDIAYIKRVIGVPGDKLEIVHNIDGSTDVLINDVPLVEDYIKDRYEYPVCNPTMLCGPMILGESEYFMLGDNRGHSADSRYWGVLNEDRFIGKAVVLARLSKLK